jgi:hypothetical protein
LGGMLRVTIASSLPRNNAGSRYERYLRQSRSIWIRRGTI